MRWKLLSISLSVFLIGTIIFSYFYFLSGQEELTIDSVLLKTSIKSGSSFNGKLKVSNIGEKTNQINVREINLGKIAEINPRSFELQPGVTKEVQITFSNKDGLKENIYVGSIEVSNKENKRIPVILEIESEDILFDSSIDLFPKGNIFLGDKINTEIKIYDLSKIGTSTVEMDYFLEDFEGEILASGTENIVVKDQTSITKSFDIPKTAKEGDYVFAVVIRYKDSVGISSNFLRIEKKRIIEVFDKDTLKFAIVLVFALFVILIFVFYSIYSRDKIFDELRSQYKREMKKEEEKLREKENRNMQTLETKEEKQLNKKIFIKIRKEKKEAIGRIQKQRIQKIKKLKKRKKKNEIKKQLEKWKKQGYNTGILEKTKIPTAKEIKGQIEKWKKLGYNTKVLEGK